MPQVSRPFDVTETWHFTVGGDASRPPWPQTATPAGASAANWSIKRAALCRQSAVPPLSGAFNANGLLKAAVTMTKTRSINKNSLRRRDEAD